MSSGDDGRAGNAVVERHKPRTMSNRQTCQMAVGHLATVLYPLREIRCSVIIRHLNDDATTIGSKPSQEPNRVFHRHPQVRGLMENPHESKLRD